MTEPILAFKAGRGYRREGSNFVDFNPRKGAILLFNEDGLLHLKWKNRETNEVEEDLILFPGDAQFLKVTESSWGRTYVLKFSSSDQRHFFWMQDASSQRDDEFANNFNALIQDIDSPLTWSESSSSGQAAASTSSQSAAPPAGPPAMTPGQMEQLRTILTSMAGGAGAQAAEPTMSLRDVLTIENLTPLFTNHPDLISTLFPHLPADLPVPPSAEVLQQIISSHQFQAAVSNFDQALHTGMLGGLVRGLGLPEEAGTGVEPFLRAVQEQAQNQQGGEGGENSPSGAPRGDSMETD